MSAGARSIVVGAGIVLLILAIGVVDLRTGRPYNFSIFYVVPTAAAGWYLGHRFGVAAGVLSGLSWDVADYVIRTNDPAASLWNGLTRVGVFSALAYLTATLRVLLDSLRRSQGELRGLLAQRDEFLSLMAHDVRAPVSAIEVIATGLSTSTALVERERRALRQLVDQARDLSALAEGVLVASQLDAGTVQLEPERFDMAELIADVAAPHPRVRHDPLLAPILVTADRNAMRRAVANLVDNALKFSGSDEPVEVRVTPGGGGTFVQVIDRGVGLTPEEAARLFRKHSRIRNEATQRVEGVGLGLYLTRLIVEAHKGSVSVKSEGQGHGSIFSLWLPDVGAMPIATPAASFAERR